MKINFDVNLIENIEKKFEIFNILWKNFFLEFFYTKTHNLKFFYAI